MRPRRVCAFMAFISIAFIHGHFVTCQYFYRLGNFGLSLVGLCIIWISGDCLHFLAHVQRCRDLTENSRVPAVSVSISLTRLSLLIFSYHWFLVSSLSWMILYLIGGSLCCLVCAMNASQYMQLTHDERQVIGCVCLELVYLFVCLCVCLRYRLSKQRSRALISSSAVSCVTDRHDCNLTSTAATSAIVLLMFHLLTYWRCWLLLLRKAI